ncbi:GDSL-type esterase/lipase family protein [Nocardia sp. NPDC059091]|uniref:GDSL-type esterase/lipase family protein n=1 Tax=unclassified Nocardia TaxID=2637762 RepID=UPI0036A9BFED
MLTYRLGRGYMLRTSIAMRASQFALLPTPAGRVVFFGDSITEGGLWDEWFPQVRPINRGISGNTIDDLRARLDTAIDAPAAVFLLIGTNDLSLGRSPGRVGENLRELVTEIRECAPHAPLHVQSVMPRKAKFADRIHTLNAAVWKVAAEADAAYIDLWPALADANGALRPEFTRDGLHLSGAGYAAWIEVLRPHVAALGIEH